MAPGAPAGPPERRRGPPGLPPPLRRLSVATYAVALAALLSYAVIQRAAPSSGCAPLLHRKGLLCRNKREERVAVCIAGQLRAVDVTAATLRRHVLDPLGADTFLIAPKSGQWEQHELYGNVTKKVIEEDVDVLALARGSEHFARYLEVPGNFIAPADRRPGGCLFQYWNRQQCLDVIAAHEAETGRAYDRVMYVRSGLEYRYDHPSLDQLPNDRVWIPSGEDHTGVNDRSALMSRADAEVYFGLWRSLLDGSALATVRRLKASREGYVNAEKFLQAHLEANGVKIGRYYAVAALRCCSPPELCRGQGAPGPGSCPGPDQQYKYEHEAKHMLTNVRLLEALGGWRGVGAPGIQFRTHFVPCGWTLSPRLLRRCFTTAFKRPSRNFEEERRR